MASTKGRGMDGRGGPANSVTLGRMREVLFMEAEL